LYVPRPVVAPELFASLRPQTYTEAMDTFAREAVNAVPALPAAGPAAGGKKAKSDKAEMADVARRSVQLGAEFGFDAKAAGVAGDGASLSRLALGNAPESVAKAANLGDFFQYVIDHPVSLPRQKSAMLPIVSTEVEGAKVSIYNEHTLVKHPLLGLRLKNTTGVHLMQGP